MRGSVGAWNMKRMKIWNIHHSKFFVRKTLPKYLTCIFVRCNNISWPAGEAKTDRNSMIAHTDVMITIKRNVSRSPEATVQTNSMHEGKLHLKIFQLRSIYHDPTIAIPYQIGWWMQSDFQSQFKNIYFSYPIIQSEQCSYRIVEVDEWPEVSIGCLSMIFTELNYYLIIFSVFNDVK